MDTLQKIYLVGNKLVQKDSMPFKIVKHLRKAFPKTQFLEFDPTENFPKEKTLIFIDTIINIKKPKLCSSIDEFESVPSKNVSLHSFDFYIELALQKKIDKSKELYIVGVPPKGDIKKVAGETARLLKRLLRPPNAANGSV